MTQSTHKILFVDDEPILLRTYARILQGQYTVDTAGDGFEARRKLAADGPYAAVVSDRGMPGMDGMEAIRHIRQDPQIMDIPIIAHTAMAMKGDEEKCLAAGANAYCAKPVSLKKLKRLIGDLSGN